MKQCGSKKAAQANEAHSRVLCPQPIGNPVSKARLALQAVFEYLSWTGESADGNASEKVTSKANQHS